MSLSRPTLVRAAGHLLSVGVAAPAFAIAVVLVATVAYPGFDHARQYISELGGGTAVLPLIFNAGILIAGVMTAVAGAGFGLAVVLLARAPVAGAGVGLLFALAGLGLILSSIYPWPDPRHMAINLGLGIQLAPAGLLIALRRVPDLVRLKRFLGVAFAVMVVLTLFTRHLIFPGTVNDANVGYWERVYAVVLVGWVGVAAYELKRALTAATFATSTTDRRQPLD